MTLKDFILLVLAIFIFLITVVAALAWTAYLLGGV